MVTGGSGYLGSACIDAMKDLGAIMVNTDIVQRPEGKEDLFISQKNAFCKLFQKVQDTYGTIDVIVNCGVCGGRGMTSKHLEFMTGSNICVDGGWTAW